MAQYRVGQFDVAIKPLTKYVETTEDVEGLFFLAMAHHQVGNDDEAKTLFRKSDELDPWSKLPRPKFKAATDRSGRIIASGKTYAQ